VVAVQQRNLPESRRTLYPVSARDPFRQGPEVPVFVETRVGMGNACEAGVIVCICLSPAKIEPLCGHCRFYSVGYLERQPCYYKWP